MMTRLSYLMALFVFTLDLRHCLAANLGPLMTSGGCEAVRKNAFQARGIRAPQELKTGNTNSGK